MVEYCDTPETERREQTGNTKQTYTLNETSLLDLTPRLVLRRRELIFDFDYQFVQGLFRDRD